MGIFTENRHILYSKLNHGIGGFFSSPYFTKNMVFFSKNHRLSNHLNMSRKVGGSFRNSVQNIKSI